MSATNELIGPFDALSLCKDLRESGRSDKKEWLRHADILEDLLRTLKREPLQFEDAWALALINDGWKAEDAWKLARKAARETSTKAIREAMEAESRNAYEEAEEAERASILRRRSTPAELAELLSALA